MEPLNIKLFGTPSVFKKDKRIVFPSRKIEALFYYIFVNKEASREELAAILWPDADAQTGRKNVRNSLYYIKKSLGSDAILTPNNSIVMFNQELQVSSDLERLLNDDEWLDAYTGDFMQGFTVKDEEALEDWILNSREKYKSIYVHKLYKMVKEDFAKGMYSKVELYARKLIEIDEYDERAYRAMIKALIKMNMYNKAVDVYKKLCEKLSKDLGIVPDLKTRKLYENIHKARNSVESHNASEDKKIFYGRKQELALLHNNYKGLKDDNYYQSILIMGEAGIGKTALKDKFIEEISEEDIFVIESACYQAEEEFPLRPWAAILTKAAHLIKKENIHIPFLWKQIIEAFFPTIIFDSLKSEPDIKIKGHLLKIKMLEETVISLFRKILSFKKMILVFDDIQWMDDLSISLLAGMMLHVNKNILIVATCRNGHSQRIEDFIADMSRHNRIKKIELDRLTKKEVIDFAKQALPNYGFQDYMYEKIYKETEGNTFFIVEYINSLRENKKLNIMSGKMNDILKSRLIGISEEGIKILNIASMFFDDISLDILAEISGLDKIELLDIIEDLIKRFIIKEVDDKLSPCIMFTHQKLRDYIYSSQSKSRKQILHKRIARIFESKLMGDDRDIALYPKLVYHYSKCGDIVSSLKYTIKVANFYLDINHELFPILYKSGSKEIVNPRLKIDDSIKYINNIEEQLKKLKELHLDTEESEKLEIAFYHMKGRYFIRQGQYEKGIKLISKMIDNSLRIGDINYALKGYRQLIYYGIQTRDMNVMKKNIEIGLEMAKENGLIVDVAIFLRLYGLYKIMTKEYDCAEELLKQCIDKFLSIDKSKDKYCMHIAAAYSYLGDIRRYNMRFQRSLEYYDKAISLCEGRIEGSSLAIFCTNAGQAAFDAGDYIRAKSYFARAFEIYPKVDSIWGRGTAEGYMTLLLISEGQYKKALERLKKADEYSKKIKNPYEIGLIYRIKAEIKYKMATNKELKEVFKEYLCLDLSVYCEKGIEYLNTGNDAYQIDIIKMFAGLV